MSGETNPDSGYLHTVVSAWNNDEDRWCRTVAAGCGMASLRLHLSAAPVKQKITNEFIKSIQMDFLNGFIFVCFNFTSAMAAARVAETQLA